VIFYLVFKLMGQFIRVEVKGAVIFDPAEDNIGGWKAAEG
jgi:hypothetical protein